MIEPLVLVFCVYSITFFGGTAAMSEIIKIFKLSLLGDIGK